MGKSVNSSGGPARVGQVVLASGGGAAHPDYSRPALPNDVARMLRQEAAFGCVRCGHPYIEYHHIIPWAEEQHFRPEDMMAVCPNCHAAVAKLSQDRQHELKARAFNRERGIFAGALQYEKSDLAFRVGGTVYESVPIILQFRAVPIISCRLADGQALVSVQLFNRDGGAVLSVIDNEVTFRADSLWDFEYAHNWAVARSGPRDIALRFDFRGDQATIEGKLWVGGRQVLLRPDHTNLPGNNIFSGRVVGCAVGIQVG